MNKKTHMKILELSFDVFETILLAKKYNSKEEVMLAMKNALNLTKDNATMPTELKLAYVEAYKKLDILTWEEMLEVIAILNAED